VRLPAYQPERTHILHPIYYRYTASKRIIAVKRKRSLSVLSLFVVVLFLWAQSTQSQSVGFSKLYDVLDFYIWRSASVIEVHHADFEGYIYAGTKCCTPKNYYKIVLFGTDQNGNISWNNEYGKDSNLYFAGGGRSLITTHDNNFVLAGATYDSSGLASTDAFLMKFDVKGDTIWTRKYGWALNSYDRFFHCIMTDDHGFILIGMTAKTSPSLQTSDVYVVKTDSAGNLQWQRKFGWKEHEEGNTIEMDHGGTYIIGGVYATIDSSAPLIMRIDQNGNLIDSAVLWKGTNRGAKLLVSHDSTYLVYSLRMDSIGLYRDAWLARLDYNFNILWQKDYGGPWSDAFLGALELSDSTLVLMGETGKHFNGTFGLLMKLTMDGDTLWSRYYYKDSIVPNYFFDLQQTSDGGFLMGGISWGNDPDAWLLKVDSIGCLIPGCDSIITGLAQKFITEGEMHIYPTPFSDHAWAEAIIPSEFRYKQSFILLIDILGRQIRQIPLYPDSQGHTRVRINRNGLTAGMYFYRLVAGGEVLSVGKVVVQ